MTTPDTTPLGAPLSEGERDRLALMYSRHVEIHYGGEPRCRRCNVLWPCDAALLLAELRARRDPLLPDVPLAGFSDEQVMAALPVELKELLRCWEDYDVRDDGCRDALLDLARHDLTVTYQLGLARAAVEEAQRHEREADEQAERIVGDLVFSPLTGTPVDQAFFDATLLRAIKAENDLNAANERAEQENAAHKITMHELTKLRAEREALAERVREACARAALSVVATGNAATDLYLGRRSAYLDILALDLAALLAPTAESEVEG
jgi:hypothetical protein